MLGPGCARSMVTVSEWLGADYKTKGVKRVLSDRIKAGLEAASTQTMWNMDDVPNFEAVDEAHLDEAGKMLKRFLGTVLTDVEAESRASVTKAGSGTPISFSGTERMRLDEWVDGLVLSYKQPVVAPQQLSTAQVGQLQTDLKTQGMPDESDLMWFELTRHTGRPAAPGDTEGGTYLGKASATKGGVAHRKAGEETYSKVLNEAVANEDFGRIERWNEQLVEVLDSSEHRYAGQASLLIMGMMQKLTSTLGRGKHALLYLQLHDERHTGRGLPNGKMLDEGIYKTVIGRSFLAPTKVGLEAVKGLARAPAQEASGSTVSGSSFPSSLGTSASNQSTALEGQLGKMMEALSGLGTKMDDQAEKISTVTRRLQSVEDKVAHNAKGPKCNKCKQFGHIAADCTNTAKKEE